MEEDVEIQLLLQSNEQLLMESARTPIDELDPENGKLNPENDELNPENDELNHENDKSNPKKTELNPENDELNPENDELNPENDESNPEKTNCTEGNESCLELGNIESKQEVNYGDEVQELLDHHMLVNMAKEPTKHFPPVYTTYSDEESISSEDNYGSNGEDNYFINEIMADDEPKYRGRVVEQLRKQIGNKNKSTQSEIINELVLAKRLILERDNLLVGLETKLQQELNENEIKQKKVRDRQEVLSTQEKVRAREPSFTRCFYKKFGMPYFHDNFGFHPPHNEDTQNKIDKGELIITSVPKVKYWIKTHKEMLLEAIRQTIVEENCEKLVKEIKKLKGMVGQAVGIDDDVLLDKITEKQNMLRLIRKKSYLELVSKEDPEREYDWMKYSVSVFDGNHSSEECRRFWHVYLKPSINKTSWGAEEDSKLMDIAKQMEYQDWEAIAKLLGTNRTPYQCLVHFQTRIHAEHDFSSGKWTAEEDNKLITVVNVSKIGDFIPWTKVSSHMGNRTHNQVYNRWSNSLNPKLIKGRFTKEEDLLIVSGIEVFKASYREMSTLLNNRSSAQIRERYERHLLPKTAKVGTWSLSEDEKLLSLIQIYGEQNWSAIAKEMKTRSRTQVRQRYGFIKHMQRIKPGWSIKKVKRRQLNTPNKELAKTQRYVEKIKQEIEAVEKAFKLSNVESDTFHIEKLKELKDKIMMKRFDLNRKKKVFAVSSEVNNSLLEYFKHSQPKPFVKTTKFQCLKDYNAYFNEILLMANYFGHKLQLPETEDEIILNTSLNTGLKYFLLETVKTRKVDEVRNSDGDHACSTSSLNCEEYIDYVPPERNDDIVMHDWWHTPPFDVTNLNFSEFFKRTVFDYSYGMHQDIWTSKLHRSSVVNFSSRQTNEPEESRQQPFFIPPNLLTTVGFRSTMLSKVRLKKDASEKATSSTLAENLYNQEETVIKSDNEIIHKFLGQFLETMVTLFTWPKVLSLTNISSTTIISNIPRKPQKRKRRSKKSTNVEIPDEMKEENILKINKMRRAILLRNEERKREQGDHLKGIRYKRKMKIEHLIKDKKAKQWELTKDKSKVRKSETTLSQGLTQISSLDCYGSKGRRPRRNSTELSVIENEINEPENEISFRPTINTYTRPKVIKRRSTNDEAGQPAQKQTKIDESSSGVENCLDRAPKLRRVNQQKKRTKKLDNNKQA